MHWYLCKEDLNPFNIKFNIKIHLKLPKYATYVFIHDLDKNLSSFDCTLLDLAVTILLS